MSESILTGRTVIAKEKRCCACREVKPASEFHKSNHHAGGLVAKCKVCTKLYKDTQWKNREDCIARGIQAQRAREREFREKDPVGFAEWQYQKHRKHLEKHGDKIREKRKQQRRENPELKEKWYAASRRWAEQNKDKVRAYVDKHREKVKDDPQFKLNNKIACGFWRSLRGQKTPSSWEALLGYTVEDLKSRLMETMPDGYVWDDVLSGKLHIDHIIPKCAFTYQSTEDEEFKVCWALMNLQLLTDLDNRKKHATIPDWFEKVFKEDESPSLPASDSKMVSPEIPSNTEGVLE